MHRDLKPENVMTIADPTTPSQQLAKLVDFGLAKLIRFSGQRSESWLIMGTPAYMSPEQCRGAGQVDAKTDSYALGVMLYELLAGRLPFDSKWAGDLIGMHLHVEPQPLSLRVPGIDPRLAGLVHRLLQKDKGLRPSMSQVTKDLGELLLQLEREGGCVRPGPAPIPDGMAPTDPGSPAIDGIGGLAADREGGPRPDSHSDVQDAEALIETEEEESPLDIPREEPLSDVLPSQEDLDALFLHATSARIVRGSLPEGDAVGPSVLLKLDRGRLAELRDALRIRPGNMLLRCECSNAYTIELRDARGPLTRLSYHPHPRRSSLGLRAWRGDGELLAGAALLYFLESEGLSQPLKDFDEDCLDQDTRRNRRPWEIIPDLAEWLPQSVREPLNEWLLGGAAPIFSAVLSALRQAFRDDEEVAAKLLGWLGIATVWQAHPAGGQVAALRLLHHLDCQVVISAAHHASSEVVDLGTVRFLTSSDVLTRCSRLLSQVPADLWERLFRLDAAKKDSELRTQLSHAAHLAQAQPGVQANRARMKLGRPQLGAPPGPLSGLVSDGTGLYSISRRMLVKYTPGQPSWSSPLHAPSALTELASCGSQILLTSRTEGIVYRMLSQSAEAEVLAANRNNPQLPVFSGQQPCWMEETPIALAQGNGLSVMRRKLVGRGADAGLVEILPLPGQLLAMVGDSSHLFYLESQATEPVRLQCILQTRSQPRTLYNFDKRLFPAGRTTLALSGTHILCPEGSAIRGIPKPGDQDSFLMQASGPVVAIAVASHGVYALVGRPEDSSWHVEYGVAGQASLHRLGSFSRAADQSVGAAVLGDELYVACGTELYCTAAS
ncbi:MAG TPA: protein kinase [Pseudomonadota bacterium]|nr:protein kinase [Pseudomonadota bacterium]